MKNRFALNAVFLKNNWQIIVLVILSCLTHFLFLNYPAQVVFDEVHFGQFVSAYFTHQYYFDIHPPLGKLMIAGFAYIFGFHDILNFSQISQPIDANDIYILRFLPALFGAFFAPLIYYLILKSGLSKKAALLGSCLVLFDSAILVQSKLILVDIFLLFFGFLSLYFLFCYKDSSDNFKKSYIFLALAAVSAALSFSVKWTGLAFFALIIAYLALEFFKKFNLKQAALKLAIVVFLPFLVYFFVFAIHFKILYKSGAGEAFMSPAFQGTLLGNKNSQPVGVKPVSSWQKFYELNMQMYSASAGLKATHPYSSKWYQWPLDKRPIWYWSSNISGKLANIYFLGNPLVWWPVLWSVLFSVPALLFKSFRKKVPPIFYFFLIGYLGSLLPFIFIGRVAFLYHYFTPLVFGILMVAVLYDAFLNNKGVYKKVEKIIYPVFLAAVFLAFLLLAPITYGLPISSGAIKTYQQFINFLM